MSVLRVWFWQFGMDVSRLVAMPRGVVVHLAAGLLVMGILQAFLPGNANATLYLNADQSDGASERAPLSAQT